MATKLDETSEVGVEGQRGWKQYPVKKIKSNNNEVRSHVGFYASITKYI